MTRTTHHRLEETVTGYSTTTTTTAITNTVAYPSTRTLLIPAPTSQSPLMAVATDDHSHDEYLSEFERKRCPLDWEGYTCKIPDDYFGFGSWKILAGNGP